MESLLTSDELAKLLKINPRSLANMRQRGGGIPYIKVGNRAVRYDPAEVQRYLESGRVDSASAAKAAKNGGGKEA